MQRCCRGWSKAEPERVRARRASWLRWGARPDTEAAVGSNPNRPVQQTSRACAINTGPALTLDERKGSNMADDLLDLDQRFAQRIRSECAGSDPESAHLGADGILVEMLRELGLNATADAYEAVEPKWYA